jgi:fibro-slime domain-containing protein
MHFAAEGTIDFDAQAASLNIAVGGRYTLDVFHAERHTRASDFKITTNISCFTPSIVK